MIGKMYRPLKISFMPGKRGYEFLHKFNSHFGGSYKFTQEIYLNYNASKKTERVQINFVGLNIPVIVKQSKFVQPPTIVETTVARTVNNANESESPSEKRVKVLDYMIENYETEKLTEIPLRIETFRKISRPTRISSKGNLEFGFIITSTKEDENDVLIVEMEPKIIDGDEYMVLNVICKTPVNVSASKRVSYVDGSEKGAGT